MTISIKKIIPVVIMAVFVFVNAVLAATIVKGNNQDNLNTTTSWTGGIVPGLGDTARWDGATGTNTTLLGANLNWLGAQIANLDSNVWITILSGNTLTLGSSGIDVSGPNPKCGFTANCDVALGQSQTWNVASKQKLSFVGVVSGAQPLIKSGTGTLIFAGANSFSGGFTINSGIVQVGDNANENATGLGAGAVAINPGATLWFKPGAVSTTYNFANSFTVNGGTLIGDDGIQHLATGAGATFAIGASGGKVEATWSAKDVYIDGILSGSSTLVVAHGPTDSGQSAGVHITNTANSFSGIVKDSSYNQDMWLNIDSTMALQYATVNLVSGGAGKPYLILNSTGATTIAGLTGSAGIVWTNSAAGTYTLNVNNAVNNAFGGTFQNNNSGVLALTKTGAGTLTLSGTNTYTGATTISGGILSAGTLANGGVASNIGQAANTADKLIINGGALTHTGGAVSCDHLFTVGSGGATINASGSGALTLSNSGAVAYSGSSTHIITLAGTSAAANTLTPIIGNDGTNAVSVVKSGAGSWTLSGVNTYTGGTMLNTGTLVVTNKNSLGLGTSTVTLNGGTLQMPGMTDSNALNVAGTAAINGTGGANLYLYGIMSGSGTINVSQASNIVSLEKDLSAFSGTINFSGGIMRMRGSAPTTAVTTHINLTSTAALNFATVAAGPIQIGSLTSASGTNVYLSHQYACQIGSLNKNDTIAGVIADSAAGSPSALTKMGTGTLTISGANTYTGVSTVSAGTLLIANASGSGTGAGAVNISSGATLGGTGKIGTKASTVTVNGVLAPGVGGPGKLIINNNLTFVSGAAFNVDINGAVPSIGYDLVVDTGTVTLGNATLSLTLGYAPAVGQTFTIIDNDGVDAVVNTFNGIPEGGSTAAVFGGNTYVFTVSYHGGTGNDIVLTCIAPPTGLAYSSNPAAYVTGTVITANTASVTGTVDSFTTPSLPAGLLISKTTGAITGTPTTAQAATDYVITARNAAGSTTVILSIAINAALTAPSNLTYSFNPATYMTGTAITANTASVTGTVDSFTTPSLPAGLSIAKATGAITGTPTTAQAATGYVVTARNAAGFTTVTLSIAITAALSPPSNLAYTVNPATYSKGTAITANTASVTGTVDSFTTPSLPAGLSIAKATGAITGTPTTAQAATDYVVTARNSAGSTTATLNITVQEPPAFTLQPFTKTVGVGTDAAFAIQTTGTPAPTYVWIRNAADTIKGAVSATVTLDSVQGADDKSYYRCVARNAAGSVTSALCTLRVVSANFSATPLTGADSVTVKFTDLSTGGAASYRWEFGDGDSAISSNPTHKYPAPGKYSVKQTVSAAGIIETALKADYITVNYSKPRPGFGADTTQASDSLLVHFRDQSSGVITGRKWSFGDKSPVDTSANPSHLYKDTGSFTVKLVVTGPGGTDSATRANLIFVYAKSDNPVRIKGQRISASSVEITFSNFSSVQTSAKTPLPPFADTVSLWFKRGGLPLSTQNDSVLKKYSLIQMQKNVSGSFKDTIGVPYSAPASLVYYGFNTALVWNDRSRSPMKPGNGDSLLMQDTVKPTNTLTFWGIYLGGDSAALNVEGVSGLDTAKDSAVGLWYGFKAAANFSDPSYTRWFTVSAVLNKAVNNRFTYILHEPLSGGDTLWVYAAEAVMGRNLLQSAVKDTSFKAGRLRPANPVRLQAKVVSPTSIRLSWWDMSTGAALTGVDSIVIWSGVKPVPALNASAPGGFTALTPPVADTTLLKSGLNEKTRYYFGAQTFKDGLWSLVTDSSSAGDSTPAILDTARPVNTIKNVFLTFDTTQNGIAVNWRIDAPDTGEEIGIAYSLTTYPADTASPPQQIARVKGASDSAALTLGEPLVFDSTYYVSLWLRKNGGKWSPPTSSSVAKITLPSLSWQTVTYFTKFPDTVTAFGGRIRLANDSGVVTPATDKLIYDKTLTDSLNGFAPVSIGFYFQQKIASSPFHVGIAYDTALLPKGYNAGDIRIYHDSAGSWFVERGTIIDTARNMAWVLTRKPDFPFIAMVDTMPPSITVLSSTTAPVHGGVAVADSFAIRDNVANMTWNYRYAKGEDSYAAGDSMVGVSRGAIDSVITSIPGVMVNQNNGTRVQFIVGDGVRWKTADVSRQVYCDSALNVIKTSEITWYPLRVSTKFDSTGVKHVLRNLSKSGEDWYYDNTKFRLFRWYSYDDNADSAQKWVEYSEKNDLMFTFDPGKLFWIKTRKAMTLNLGASVTPSLRSPSPVSLAPKAITDFSLPLGFDVFIGDVFASTDADTVNNRGIIADSLQVYSFTADSTGHYRAVALHLGHFAKSLYHLADPADTLTSKGGGYCVYNPYNVAVRLLIPPVPVSMSKMRAAVAKKAKAPAAPGNWALAVTGRTAEGMLLSTVYCGHNEGGAGRVYLPAMPMMDGVGIRACDEAKRQFGHVISGGASAKEGGETYPLAFCNQSGGPRTIVFQVEGLESLPKSMRAVIANFATESFEDARTPLIVAMNDGENAYRRLVVGTDEYLAKVKIGLRVFRLDLTGAYPNPFARRLIIRFNLPESGLDQVRFSIVNMSGRKVWERAVVCGALAPGAQELAWDGNSVSGRPVAAGMYVLRMTALDGRGKRVGSFEKKITYLP